MTSLDLAGLHLARARVDDAAPRPRVRYVTVSGIEHHLLEWQPPAGPGPVALLLHGSKDRGTSFDRVAPSLAAAGFSVFAPDMRGHGATGSGLPSGGYAIEHFVVDAAELCDLLSPGAPVFLVGHSFGGIVATLLAGSFPRRVGALALVEGLGLAYPSEAAPDRLRTWAASLRVDRARPPRLVTLDHATRTLAAWNPEVDRATIEERVVQLTQPVGDELAWWFDPAQWRVLWELSFDRWRAHALRVVAPALIVSGGPSGHHPADERERIGSFARARTVEIPGAGHMVHWTAPSSLAQALVAFARPLWPEIGDRT